MTEQSESVPGGENVIRLDGDVVFDTVPRLWRAQLHVFEQNGEITVDLSGVKRVDSSALALLLGWIRLARKAGKKLSFNHIPEALLAIARVTGVEPILRDPLA